MLVSAQGEGRSAAPRLSDYSPQVERLDAMIDATNGVAAAVIAAAGAKPPHYEPRMRPRTAVDEVRHRTRLAKHDALTARLMRRNRPEAERSAR